VGTVDSGLRYVVRTGFRRGFRGQSIWFVLGTAAWLVLRAVRSRDEVVYRTVLKPGERLVVSTGGVTAPD
jgi:hypothetical protein